MSEHESLTPAVFHILLALSKGDMHGYAIMQFVDDFANGTVPMGPGTLYGSIKRMLASDLIQEVDAPSDEVDSRRKYYALTLNGHSTLTQELVRLSAIIDYAHDHNLLGDTE